MPELPEVETVRRGISPHIVGKQIAQVRIRERRLRWPIPDGLEGWLQGRTVQQVARRGKYLLLSLDSGSAADRLIIHLGMSGRLYVIQQNEAARKHDHLDLSFADGTTLRFNDPRRFGAVLPWSRDLAQHDLIAGMGPEPLSADFGPDYLFRRSRGRKQSIKTFIMDGRIVVGVGNIYASESLFRAGIRPGTAAGRISAPAYRRLHAAIQQVLSEAIEQGGTTLRDFVGGDGKPGYFSQKLYVYGRAGEPCLRCAAPIRLRVQGQRATYYCSVCQQ